MNDRDRNLFYAKLLRGEMDPPYHAKGEAVRNLNSNRQEVGYACAFAIEQALTIKDEAQRKEAMRVVRRKAGERRSDPTDPATTVGFWSQIKWIIGG